MDRHCVRVKPAIARLLEEPSTRTCWGSGFDTLGGGVAALDGTCRR